VKKDNNAKSIWATRLIAQAVGLAAFLRERVGGLRFLPFGNPRGGLALVGAFLGFQLRGRLLLFGRLSIVRRPVEIVAHLLLAVPVAAPLRLAAGVGNVLLRCGSGTGRALLCGLAGGVRPAVRPDLFLALLFELARFVLAGGFLLRSGRARACLRSSACCCRSLFCSGVSAASFLRRSAAAKDAQRRADGSWIMASLGRGWGPVMQRGMPGGCGRNRHNRPQGLALTAWGAAPP
jgi:hypothetical protein